MKIICNSIEKLRLLVEIIDIGRAVDPQRHFSGWGTAGVIVSDRIEDRTMMLPCTEGAKEGTAFSNGGDKIIATTYPKEFSWFLERLLTCELEEQNNVQLLEEVPYAHLDYCTSIVRKNGSGSKSARDEFVFICNWLIDHMKKQNYGIKLT